MNNARGFTLAEMMVAALILAVAIVGAMSFFVFQSRHGSDATKLRNTRENINLAFMLMQRDIQHAGYGAFVDTTQGSKQAVYVQAGMSSDAPDSLYVAYGTFMDMSFDMSGQTDKASIFKYEAIKNLATPTASFTYEQFPWSLDLSKAKVTRPFGGFIAVSSTGTVDAAKMNWSSFPDTLASPIPPGNWSCPITLEKSLSGDVVPAIVYEIGETRVNGMLTGTHELLRNGIRVAGGEHDVDVFNLKVQDVATIPPTQGGPAVGFAPPPNTLYRITVWYQVKGRSSLDETTAQGYNKKTWKRASVSVTAGPQTILANL